MLKNDLVVRAARGERTERTPVWLMRQAGRFDPAYRAIREQADMPLESLFCHAELAAEISLLPKKFGVDAIIFFQDILTPLAPMGARFVFRPGPVLETPIRTTRDVQALRSFDPVAELGFVPDTLRRVRAALAGDLPLLGFAGAPLTLAFFLIEGRSPGECPEHAFAMMRSEPALFRRLLDRLADMTADYLLMQIEAGVDAVQLFESCADLLTPEQYREFALPYHVKIFSALSTDVPTILFAKEQPMSELLVGCGADMISLGGRVDLADAKRRFEHRVAFQGNVDNRLLVEGPIDEIQRAVRACIEAGGHTGHILNLNHGLLANTPVEHVQCLVDTCRTTIIGSPSARVGDPSRDREGAEA